MNFPNNGYPNAPQANTDRLDLTPESPAHYLCNDVTHQISASFTPREIPIALISLGCSKNLVNSEQMLFLLREAGFEIVPVPERARVVIVNTCGFIDSAKQEAIDQILALATLKLEGRIGHILVAGCLSERYREEILTELPEVDGVLGCGSYQDVVPAVLAVLGGETPCLFAPPEAARLDTRRIVSTPRHTAYVKIAEGCDNRCAYCVIPSLRGPYRSRPLEDIVSEIRGLTENGTREIILVAQDSTRYGVDVYGECQLPALLRAICALDGVQWLRLHYLYPDEMDETLIGVMENEPKIVKYFDIPIQHISDPLLCAMNRRGTRGDIEALVKRLRNIPDAVLRTSIIVGLPGETEADFEALCDFLRETRWERAGVFTYSPEEGTPAAAMPDQVDEDVKQKRMEILLDLQHEILGSFSASLIGRTLSVLIDGFDRETERYIGRTWADSPDVDGRVLFTARRKLPVGTFADVYITGVTDGDPVGKWVPRPR